MVDGQTFKEVNRIKVAQGLAVLAFRPDGKFAYVAAREAHAVGVAEADQTHPGGAESVGDHHHARAEVTLGPVGV